MSVDPRNAAIDALWERLSQVRNAYEDRLAEVEKERDALNSANERLSAENERLGARLYILEKEWDEARAALEAKDTAP